MRTPARLRAPKALAAATLIAVLALTPMGPVQAQTLESDPTLPASTGDAPPSAPATSGRGVFQLQASETRFLPPAMYGQWSVTATLLSSDFDASVSFSPVAHDIWLLERDGDQVTLSNPVTGGFTSVSVDRVQGNTATFHHQVTMRDGRRTLLERPTVTVDGDRLYGETVQTYTIPSRNRPTRVFQARLRIEARRLAPARAQWPASTPSGGPTFEIEEIRRAPQPAKPSPPSDSRLYVR